MNTVIEYARRYLTDVQLTQLAEAGIPLTGPTGLRRWVAERDLEAFVKLYFGAEFTLPFAPVHYDMLRDLQTIRDRQVNNQSGVKVARAYPRGHSKSSYYSRILPTHAFLYGWCKLTVLLANNNDAAIRLISNIKNAIETNPAIVEDFPGIRGKQWGSERLESSEGAVVVGYGVGSGSIRGVSNPHRPGLIIGDDIDDDNSVRSTVELATNKEWFDKSVLYLGDNVGFTTSFVIIGTIIRKTSLLRYVLDSPDFDAVVERAVTRFAANTALWSEWETWIVEQARNATAPKDPDSDEFYQRHKEAMLEGTQVLWSRPDAYYRAMVSKLHNEKAFWSELQNDPKDADSLLGAIRYIARQSFNEHEYDLLAVLDSTTAGGKQNDQAAFVELLYHKRARQLVVWHIDSKTRSYTDTIDTIVGRAKTRGRQYQGFWVEVNSAGSVIRDLLAERFARENLLINPVGVHNTLPKAERIGALSEYISRGQLVFCDDFAKDVMEQIEMYPYHRYDDVLDAIATVVLWLRERGMLELPLPNARY